MNQTFKYIFNFLKLAAIIFLLIVVFNFFFDRANRSDAGQNQKESIEAMISTLENQVKDMNNSQDEFEYPIQRRAAAEYTVVEKSVENVYGDKYLYICAVSAAVGQVQRAQTIVNIGIDYQKELQDAVNKMEIYLAPAESLCQESSVIGIGYYVASSDGWQVVSTGQWQWLVRTSNAKVNNDQIIASELYMKHKAEYKSEFGMNNYSEELDAFVAEQLGRDPKYVTAGMWNDDFVKQ